MKQTWPVILGLMVVAAAVFLAVYPILLRRYSRGLVSTYSKADTRKRLSAAAVDALIVATLAVVAATMDNVLYVGLGAGYLLLRDTMGGQSIGKLLLGLVVVEPESGRPASWRGSLGRNVLLLLPGSNVPAILLEARTIVTDPRGQRLGDRLAQTQVVEGRFDRAA